MLKILKKFLVILMGLIMIEAKFISIDAETLVKMQEKGVVVIDIRTPQEWMDTGIIKGAIPIMFFDPMGRYNVDAWLNEFRKVVKDKNQPFIIYCAHANRSKIVGTFLSDKLGYKNVYELKGGIIYGWIDKGRKTVPFRPKN